MIWRTVEEVKVEGYWLCLLGIWVLPCYGLDGAGNVKIG